MKKIITGFLRRGYTDTQKYKLDDLIKAFYPLKHIAQTRKDGKIWLKSNKFGKKKTTKTGATS